MFGEAGVALAAPLEVDLTARSVGEGVLVRGEIRGTVRLACRRCLAPVEREVEEHVELLYLLPTGDDEEDTGGEVYPLPARGDELDLTEAVREQVLLEVPEYALCGEECRGLCPTCGANLNEGACECVPEAAPGPWDALKKITFDD
jgi:DUF177 domain-containing protein